MADMIRNALETIQGMANDYLQNFDRRGDDWIVLTSLVDHDGVPNPVSRDKIVMCVHNISRETVVRAMPAGAGSPLPMAAPPLYIDLHLMFMANFTGGNYRDGLAGLSRLIGYFQQVPVFDQASAPGLDRELDRLTLEFENLDAADLDHVMSMLGTRYLPSAFYRLRMIPFAAPPMLPTERVERPRP